MHIVVTCTDTKTVSVHPSLTVRTLPTGPPSARVREWIGRLEGAPGERIPVRDLYRGNHWSIVKSLEAEAANVGVEATLWVASAGYGLLSMEAQVHPYAATFSKGP